MPDYFLYTLGQIPKSKSGQNEHPSPRGRNLRDYDVYSTLSPQGVPFSKFFSISVSDLSLLEIPSSRKVRKYLSGICLPAFILVQSSTFYRLAFFTMLSAYGSLRYPTRLERIVLSGLSGGCQSLMSTFLSTTLQVARLEHGHEPEELKLSLQVSNSIQIRIPPPASFRLGGSCIEEVISSEDWNVLPILYTMHYTPYWYTIHHFFITVRSSRYDRCFESLT